MKILVLSDSAFVFQNIKDTIKDVIEFCPELEVSSIIIAKSGDEFFQKYVDEKPDFVIINQFAPNLKAEKIDFVSKLREIDKDAIIMSTIGFQFLKTDEDEKAKEYGVDEVYVHDIGINSRNSMAKVLWVAKTKIEEKAKESIKKE